MLSLLCAPCSLHFGVGRAHASLAEVDAQVLRDGGIAAVAGGGGPQAALVKRHGRALAERGHLLQQLESNESSCDCMADNLAGWLAGWPSALARGAVGVQRGLRGRCKCGGDKRHQACFRSAGGSFTPHSMFKCALSNSLISPFSIWTVLTCSAFCSDTRGQSVSIAIAVAEDRARKKSRSLPVHCHGTSGMGTRWLAGNAHTSRPRPGPSPDRVRFL